MRTYKPSTKNDSDLAILHGSSADKFLKSQDQEEEKYDSPTRVT